MSWFEEQIKKRKESDQQLLENAFVQAAGIIYGQKNADEFVDERIITEHTADEILKYFHLKPVDIPESVTGSKEQLNFCLRHYGLMKREVLLDSDWFRHAFGVMLTHRKDNGNPVVLLPDQFGGCYRFADSSGHMRRINRKNAELFEKTAFCFYKPLPQGKLTAKDLLYYMNDCVQIKDKIHLVSCVLFMTAVGLLIPQTVRLLVSETADSHNNLIVASLGVSLLCTVLGVQLIGTIVDSLIRKIKSKTSLTVHSAIMMRILSLPPNLLESLGAGELAGIFPAVDELCEQIISATVGTGLTALASLLYILQIVVIAPDLGLPSLLTVLIAAAFGILSAVFQSKSKSRQMELEAVEAKTRYSMINGIQKIKLSGAEKRFFARWLTKYTESRRSSFSPPFLTRLNNVIMLAISLFTSILMYYIGSRNGVGAANYIAFSVAFGIVFGAVRKMTDSLSAFGRINQTMKMLDAFLQMEPETSGKREIVSDLSGGIELNHIYFRYTANAPYILKDISLKIRPKEYMGIVGKTGCGKSTLIKILLGLCIPEKGAVYYGRKDLNTLDLSTLRSKIGTVMQNGELFQGDIFSNITISAPDATLDDAWKAAETAGIADDIRRMPMGMHTLVLQGQGGISGGQKQRILIARAIVSKPKILIFDEATSALDNITQKQVSDALDQMGCTRIVIAHRLSTIKHCDRILVLDNGNVAEEGTYEELIGKHGIFAELVSRQIPDAKRQ